ncbi:hypothetical protein [Thermoanaerobacterium thermosaccharolyticum]|uniref:hypothetical protein n=1 Tax=Thermoanaerobacterium thermosaccharolyticum TaxID=1517 RepID=UPI0015C5C7C2|nr:hypothetical protein [Thermoanaerobacterium thermosaccharolyticum]
MIKKTSTLIIIVTLLIIQNSTMVFAANTQNYIRHYAWSSDWGAKIFAFYIDYSASNYTNYPMKYIQNHYVSAFNQQPLNPEIGNGNCYLVGIDFTDSSSGTLIGTLDSSKFIKNPNGSIWNPNTLVYFDLYSSSIISYYSTSVKTINASVETIFHLDPSWIPSNWTDYTNLSFTF